MFALVKSYNLFRSHNLRGLFALAPVTLPEITVGPVEQCRQQYKGQLFGGNVQRALDTVHFLSAGSVGFARGLNDTPKIVALLLVIKTFDVKFGMLMVAIAMAIGGLLNARKVAITMSKRITPLNPGQGFTANLVTSALVILASRFGLPVSTTHVSVGSLFGIGLITREANRRVVSGILDVVVAHVPIAAILSAAIYTIAAVVKKIALTDYKIHRLHRIMNLRNLWMGFA